MKNNKYFILLLAVLLIGILSLQGISAISSNDLDINLQYNPKPAFPGSYVNLTFKVENTGNDNLTNIDFILETDDPISLVSSEEQIIPLIEPGEIIYLNYIIYIDTSAKEGTESVTLNYEDFHDDFDIEIASKNVYLTISDVKTNPSEVEPGKSTVLAITLENTANSEIKDINLNLITNASPFSLQGVGERHIISLGKRTNTILIFNLTANSDAAIQIYPLPLKLTYYDIYGNFYQRQDTIYVKVYAQPDVEVVVDSNSLIVGRSGTITLKVLNKGLSSVKFTQLNILTNPSYNINSANSNYIGSINSDDYTTIDVKLTPNQQNISLNLLLSYRDLDNKEYSNQINLNLKPYTIQEAQRNGLLPGFPLTFVIILLVIIALIVWAVLRKKKKHTRP